jgi:hypothetical protein
MGLRRFCGQGSDGFLSLRVLLDFVPEGRDGGSQAILLPGMPEPREPSVGYGMIRSGNSTPRSATVNNLLARGSHRALRDGSRGVARFQLSGLAAIILFSGAENR